MQLQFPVAELPGITEGTMMSFPLKELLECSQKESMVARTRGVLVSSQVNAGENWVFWTVWIRFPSNTEPQKYKALVDTGAQCPLIPLGHLGTEPVFIVGSTGESQQLTLLEVEVHLTGKEWSKHPIVAGPEVPCIPGVDFLRSGYFKDLKGLRWAFGIPTVKTEGIRHLAWCLRVPFCNRTPESRTACTNGHRYSTSSAIPHKPRLRDSHT